MFPAFLIYFLSASVCFGRGRRGEPRHLAKSKEVVVYTGFHHFVKIICPVCFFYGLAMQWYLSCEGQQCTVGVSWQRYRWIMRESTLRTASQVQYLLTLAGKLDMWLCMTEPVQVNLSNMEFVGSICFLLLSAPSVCAVWFLSLSPSVPPFLHSPPRVAVFHSRKISTNSELPPTSTVTCTSFTLLSLFSRTFFFFSTSLSLLPGLQLLGNSWLSMRGMQLTN